MTVLGILKIAGANWKLLVGVALIAATVFLWLRLEVVKARLDATQTYVVELETTNTQNLLEIDRYKRDQKMNDMAIKAEQDRRKGVQDQLTELRSRIDNAPHDGCVGPAVHAVINGLRSQSADHKD
ncbi:hypothetical protein [Thalassospira sp.]|uniref:hypothetical protein n=1 Tax=Thalassospira sp. TaxID=1912094 RepID=UPI001B2234F5|nr:hypothetical protein [Thalassospira sp.]MBO6805748.1 hypothetical protein [Thalassospira sp.]MBO6841362.1 hypothetical protein [Thalassospira sp.]